MRIFIQWGSTTEDGLFGKLSIVADNGDILHSFPCITNLKLRILDGVYSTRVDMSPRLQYRCPHIKVPVRDELVGGDAGLRIHHANEPYQSLGCIFPGLALDGDAIDNSTEAFNQMMLLLPHDESEFSVLIETSLS